MKLVIFRCGVLKTYYGWYLVTKSNLEPTWLEIMLVALAQANHVQKMSNVSAGVGTAWFQFIIRFTSPPGGKNSLRGGQRDVSHQRYNFCIRGKVVAGIMVE